MNIVKSDRECNTPLRLRYQLGRHCLAIVCVLSALPDLLPGAELFTLDVCVATDEFPRNDHQLIFPLADGRLLLVWSEYYRTSSTKSGTQRDDMPCRISRMVSSDRGRTWGEKSILQENTGLLNVKHPNLLRLPNGDVLFFFTQWNAQNERIVFKRRSNDDCRTWSEPVRVSTLPGMNNINNDHVLMLRTGRIILPSFNSPHYGQGDHWKAFCWYSDNLGEAWRVSDERMDLPKRGAEEPSIVERKDGSLLALMRTSLGAIYRSESFDQGRTWNAPVTTLLTAPASPPCVKRIPSTNDLIVVWNHNYDETHHHQGERNPLSSAISKDDGATWQHVKDVEFKPGGAAAYASVFFHDDEAIVSYYYQEKGFGGGSGVRLKFIPIAWFYE